MASQISIVHLSICMGNKTIIYRQANIIFKPHGGALNIGRAWELKDILGFVYGLSLVPCMIK